MRRLLWAAGWVGVFFWSLFALAAYGLIDLVGGAFMRNADVFSSDPGTVEWLFNLFGWIRGFSTSAVLVVWGLVSLAILAVPWLFDRLTASPPQTGAFPPPSPAGRDGVIDLGPGDYTVRHPEPDRRGPTPRIGPHR
ncbi:hypothetical protein [Enterovirga aerilata]|uniref:Uncharacterized protein n=1 Tax=Enterovirga aerilata TaxID=2730920 RepID=A0A849II77_9HYPH|nr:hypothetical protein [Enterovirga sp. DB1703]NNM73643.1 hypothetical protein [Enterovirga sp. DB1703]